MRIRALMAEHEPRYNGRDLAAALKISPQSAGRRLNGKHDFRISELQQIADWLEVPLYRLTTWVA